MTCIWSFYIIVCFLYIAAEGTVIICQDSSSSIKCPGDKIIHVVEANYGRLNHYVCSYLKIFNSCPNALSIRLVKEACEGKSSCNLHASNVVFGNPCRLIRKYLEVKYNCSDQSE